ncbi:agamous-like MADS-box protein AGL62 [Impatiens glandulifera]|uniref:agamous-like MADS-box protein AGL62 n=1 Tax=Impatiens glandulifera TaxID=253017 RepID=UPI001FB12D9D|nr:agamous-like MADS-box protein AGL62 [Impatiens glandulifera]
MTRTNKWRKKITMSKMLNENKLQITISNKRIGVFKKSSELTTLCGIEMLLIVFSPANKVLPFAHPSVDDRLFGILGSSSSSTRLSHEAQHLVVANQLSKTRELNAQIIHVQDQLEVQKQPEKAVTQALQVVHDQRC